MSQGHTLSKNTQKETEQGLKVPPDTFPLIDPSTGILALERKEITNHVNECKGVKSQGEEYSREVGGSEGGRLLF